MDVSWWWRIQGIVSTFSEHLRCSPESIFWSTKGIFVCLTEKIEITRDLETILLLFFISIRQVCNCMCEATIGSVIGWLVLCISTMMVSLAEPTALLSPNECEFHLSISGIFCRLFKVQSIRMIGIRRTIAVLLVALSALFAVSHAQAGFAKLEVCVSSWLLYVCSDYLFHELIERFYRLSAGCLRSGAVWGIRNLDLDPTN